MSVDPRQRHLVVIGAGQAGFEVCAKLRALSMEGPITLIGAESQRPYQRPPLSKAYLLGKMELDRLFFRSAAFYDDENIDLRLSTSCIAIDRKAKNVMLSDDSVLNYDALVLTTGARPVTLPGAIGGGLSGVHYVRDLADADRMAKDIKPGRKALVIGGGYIGLEAAAVAASLGLDVTLVEASERILQRVAAVQTSDYFRNLHAQSGVKVRENVMLEELIGDDERLAGAKLSDGTDLEIDVAIVGIGIRPNQELAAAAGLDIDNGIKVDAQCRTSDPNIYAAGDCASFPFNGGRIRLESVGNAIDQGQLVAQVIAGQDAEYQAKPWFWSDQYETKLQIVGLSTGYDKIITRKSSHASVSFWYFKGDQLLAVDAMNDPRAYMVAKRLIEAGKSPDPKWVEDTDLDLKQLLSII
jgi:3-phenylpropionate/trans-cinnamate dioxygenase ferredoxin reductase subunit